MELNSNK